MLLPVVLDEVTLQSSPVPHSVHLLVKINIWTGNDDDFYFQRHDIIKIRIDHAQCVCVASALPKIYPSLICAAVPSEISVPPVMADKNIMKTIAFCVGSAAMSSSRMEGRGSFRGIKAATTQQQYSLVSGCGSHLHTRVRHHVDI